MLFNSSLYPKKEQEGLTAINISETPETSVRTERHVFCISMCEYTMAVYRTLEL